MVAIPRDIRLEGPFAPMRFEADVDDCVVSRGEVPVDLVGGFYRSGPTWKRPTKQGCNGHWTMDGMVQALIFRGDGRVDFKNRWVRTPKYLLEERHGRGLFEWSDGFDDYRCYGLGEVKRDEYTTGVPPGTNWVNAIPFGGDVLLSAEQGGPPIAVDPLTLETKGYVPWSSKLSQGMIEPACFGDGAFAAHPKWDPDTGELYGWTYRDTRPFATLHWVQPNGTVRSRALWDAPHASTLHDMWLTPDYMVLPFLPLYPSLERCKKGLSVFGWNPDLPIVLALVRRDDFDGDIRWIHAEIEPQYVMHTISGNQDGDKLILDAPIYDRQPFPLEDEVALGTSWLQLRPGRLGRWTVDLKTGHTTSERLDDRTVEFPKVDERFYGKDYRHAFLLAGESYLHLGTIIKKDVITGAEQAYDVKQKEIVAVWEPTFAPRAPHSPEGDGYLIVPVSQFTDNRSKFLLFDTSDLSQGPVAQIDLPFQIGFTPHGHWLDMR